MKRARIGSALIGALALTLLGGCWGGGGIRDDQRTDWPPMTVRQAEDRQVVVVQAPSPGWTIEFDRSERVSGASRVLLTVRRPDPAFFYPQTIVEQNVITDVRAGTPVRVYRRLAEHNERKPGGAYVLVDLND